MVSPYSSPQVAAAMRRVGTVDRWMRSAGTLLEQVLSLTVVTDPNGLIMWVLSLDIIDAQSQMIAATMVGEYPFARKSDARADGMIVARTLRVTFRVADVVGGWRRAFEPDDPPPPADDGPGYMRE